MSNFTTAIDSIKNLMVTSMLLEGFSMDFTANLSEIPSLALRLKSIDKKKELYKLHTVSYKRNFDNKYIYGYVISVDNRALSVIPRDDCFCTSSITKIQINDLDVEQVAFLMDSMF